MPRHRQPLVSGLALVLVVGSPALGQQSEPDAPRFVITLDSLDRAAFANVGELLQARVPGLYVARTGDGAIRWFVRGPASESESLPMVLVDDARINVAGSAIRDIGTRPPLLDEIDIEDVERIEVWSGPATAIRYGPGSGNGVIRIVTFAPHAQQTSLRLTTTAAVLDVNETYPANAIRFGTDTAGNRVVCMLVGEARNRCTPTGPPTIVNVLSSNPPFETATAARVAAAIASGTDRLAWRAGATFDHEGSATGTLASQRIHARGAGAFRPSRDADVRLGAHWMRGDADLPGLAEPTLLSQGLFARPDTVWPGYVQPVVSPYTAQRYGVTAQARWQARGWLDVRLTSGLERMADENDFDKTVSDGGISPLVIDARGERRRRDVTARLDVEARYDAIRVDHETALTLERAVAKHEEEFSESRTRDPDFSSYRAYWINQRIGIAGAGLTQRVHLGERAALLGALRVDQVRLGDVRWDTPVSPHLSLSWDVRPFVPRAFGGVRLRASLGDVANMPQTTGILFFFSQLGEERPKAEVTREREIGIDAKVAHDRIAASVTWYKKRTSNVTSLIVSQALNRQRIEVLNRGIEAALHTRIVQTGQLTWDVRAQYAHNHNEVTRAYPTTLFLGGTPGFGGGPGGFSRQWIFAGQPLGAYHKLLIASIQDLDGDGLVDGSCGEPTVCEIVVSSSSEFLPAYPPTTASLEMSFRFGAVTLSALLDHRRGHAMHNQIMEQRCIFRCQALYDPSTPFAEQAEAILAGGLTLTSVQDATYTKLREISLRLEMPASWARMLGGSRMHVSLAGRNVATWTDYGGLDPETTSLPWIPLANVDDAAPPLPRRFIARIELAGR